MTNLDWIAGELKGYEKKSWKRRYNVSICTQDIMEMLELLTDTGMIGIFD